MICVVNGALEIMKLTKSWHCFPVHVAILENVSFVSQVLICRNYRGDVEMSEIEHFMPILMDKEEECSLTPILSHGAVRFMWIKHNNLYRILKLF